MEILGLLWIPNWILITLVIVFIYVVYMSKDHHTFKSMGIKGPKPVPVFGNFHTMVRKGIARSYKDWINEYGNVFGVYEGQTPLLVVADADMLKDVLVKKFHCFINRRNIIGYQEPPLDSIISLMTDDAWKRVRCILTPSFSAGKLRKMTGIINAASDRLVESLEKSVGTKEGVDMKKACGAYTMDVIASAAFGIQIDSQTNPNDPFVIEARKFIDFKPYMIFALVFFRFLIPILCRIGFRLLDRNAWKFFASVTTKTIEQRKLDGDQATGKYKDFLQLMMDAGKDTEVYPHKIDTGDGIVNDDETFHQKGLTFNEILAQAIIFFIAGYETTSSSLSLVFYNLALNPDVTEKAIQEVDDVVGKEEVTYEHIAKLHYLDKILLETQRKSPTTARFDRVCNEATEVGGIHIPKGMVVDVPVAAIQHNPEYWPEPDKFDPERFSTEKRAERSPFHFMPFGYGPRNCIGLRFAVLKMKVAMVRVLQKLRPVKVAKTGKYPEIAKFGLLQIKEGAWVGFQKR